MLNAIIGPHADPYRPAIVTSTREAEDYFSEQVAWLAPTEADMVGGVTFNQASEAAGLVRTARSADMPVAISFALETDGRLSSGQSLGDAIREVDAASDGYCSYYMINCVHPDHLLPVLEEAEWTRRIRGLRANASCRSHAELDASAELDAGDPDELAAHYGLVAAPIPWMNIFGGCCGCDLRHVAKIAEAIFRR